jgi:3,4-dihydroxy 2-butanone 4-phosphate synthase/GTP cyclohydrolase II
VTVLQESATGTALGALRDGRPVVLVDDLGPHPSRELVFAASCATTRLVARAVRCTSGFLVVTLPEPEADRLRLSAQSPADRGTPAYGISVDAEGTGTGISAASRARTISLLGTPGTAPDVFIRPGHVITYRAHPDGVLGRATAFEAAFDLVRLAGAGFAAASASLVSDEDLPVVTASGVLAHRLAH